MKKTICSTLFLILLFCTVLPCSAEGFGSWLSSTSESFGSLLNDAAGDFGSLLNNSTAELDSILNDVTSEWDSIFGSSTGESSNADVDTSDTDSKQSSSILSDIGTIWSSLAAEDVGIPKVIHYGDYEQFKKDIDTIEVFFQEYVDFMKNYDASDLSMLADYTSFLARYADASRVLESLDESKMTAQEEAYYTTVLLRIDKLLLTELPNIG